MVFLNFNDAGDFRIRLNSRVRVFLKCPECREEMKAVFKEVGNPFLWGHCQKQFGNEVWFCENCKQWYKVSVQKFDGFAIQKKPNLENINGESFKI